MQNPFLNVEEAASVIGCHPSRVRQLLSDGQLEGFKVNGRAWMVVPESAEKMRDSVAPTGRPRKNSKKCD
jgi:excisionase family DNA binding protein